MLPAVKSSILPKLPQKLFLVLFYPSQCPPSRAPQFPTTLNPLLVLELTSYGLPQFYAFPLALIPALNDISLFFPRKTTLLLQYLVTSSLKPPSKPTGRVSGSVSLLPHHPTNKNAAIVINVHHSFPELCLPANLRAPREWDLFVFAFLHKVRHSLSQRSSHT